LNSDSGGITVNSDSIKLAKLWVNLKEMKDKLDNELIPVSCYLEMEDSDLIFAMEELSGKIKNHFENHQLITEGKTT
jgi:NTP pyrophosphatase (non-canonical NTP hydrolase)